MFKARKRHKGFESMATEKTVSLTQLGEQLAAENSCSNRQGVDLVKQVMSLIEGHLKEGRKVGITPMGTLEMVKKPARTGRNPQTGETLKIPERNALKFKESKRFEA